MKLPIFVALDVDEEKQALDLARQVSGSVGGFKVGPRLLMRFGPGLISQLAEMGDVFVDNKYYDIPSTTLSAVKASFEAGATFVTVHASCGSVCLEQLSELEKELNKQRNFKILAVTVLTSFDESSKPANWSEKSLSDQVIDLAGDVVRSGLSGIVCSGEEVERLKKLFPDVFFVTPGIRLQENSVDDQKRVLTPELAMQKGASALVVGRPIVKASDPQKAAELFAQAVQK